MLDEHDWMVGVYTATGRGFGATLRLRLQLAPGSLNQEAAWLMSLRAEGIGKVVYDLGSFRLVNEIRLMDEGLGTDALRAAENLEMLISGSNPPAPS